jgi:cell division protein FtsB
MSGKLRHIVFPVVIVAMMVYFTYHIFQGQRGVLAWIRLDKKLKENVIGQDLAVNSIVKSIKRNKLNIKKKLKVFIYKSDQSSVCF